MKITIKDLDRYIAGELEGTELSNVENHLLSDEKLLRLFNLMVNIEEALGRMDEMEIRTHIHQLKHTPQIWPGSKRRRVTI